MIRSYLGMRPNAETLKLYKNLGNGTFRDVTAEVGLNRQQGLRFAEAACLSQKKDWTSLPNPLLERLCQNTNFSAN